MATSLGISARLSRSSRKQDLPFNATSTTLVNKLRQDGQMNTVENVMHTIEQVSALLKSNFDGHIKDTILDMCQHLKVYGACLEVLYKEQLDRAFVIFRNSSQDEHKLDYQSRLHLLELIELRANHWKGTDVMNHYYKKKGGHNENEVSLCESSASSVVNDLSSAFMSPTTAPLLGPGEIMKASGKFSKPTRIPGKNYCKDEVVIRNADSGKVMGIKGRRVHMIEELSETIISFQRVNPGAKERLVQITGANESSISHAKQLIEDTIRRNASPIREPSSNIVGAGGIGGSSSSINSSASDESALPVSVTNKQRGGGGSLLLHSLSTGDATVGEYKYTVNAHGDTIKITGNNLDLVRISKLVLDEYFSGEPINGTNEFYNFESLPRSPSTAFESVDVDASNEWTPTTLPNGQTNDDQFRANNDSTKEEKNVESNNNTNSNKISSSSSNNNNNNNNDEGNRFVYSMDLLARMSMSPFCLAPPVDWTRISCEHPSVARKTTEVFDADRYLSDRNTVVHVLCTSASDESILSGSSV